MGSLRTSSSEALRDDFAGIHDHHPVGDRVEQLDAMLDDDDGDIHFLGEQADQMVDFIDFRIDEAGRRLIHQQQRRLAHQQTGEQKLAAVERVEARGRRRIVDIEAGKLGAIFGVELVR